jgi:hypothetical protein
MTPRVQIGETLYWQMTEPTIGQQIQTRDGQAIIRTAEQSPEDNGWLFTVEHYTLDNPAESP